MTSHFYSKKIGTAKFRITVKQNKSFPQQPTTFLPCYTHGPKKQDNKGSAGFKTVYSNTGDSEGKESSCHTGDWGSGPGSGRSPEEGNGKPLQYSCPKNPMDRGAWRAIVMESQRVGHNWATDTLYFTLIVTLDKPRECIKKERHHFPDKSSYSQSYGFSSSHVQMWELDDKEVWAPKKWCFRIVELEKTLENHLDCKEIKPVHPKGNQPWIFIGRTGVEAEDPILWPPDLKSQLIRKDSHAGKDWGQEEEG